jgi:predicted TIM-barrel fold metal-dependent hydrolase
MTCAVRPTLFDSHLHIIDPRFPLIPNQGYLPPPFTVEAYRARTAAFDLAGGAVVSGSFQGFDQTYLLEALDRLGPDFVGVTQLPATVSDQEVLALDAAGIRAVRFNLRRGGSERLDRLEDLSRRVYDLAGWHVELYVDSQDLPDLEPRLLNLPKLSIDHLGLSGAGLAALLRLVERGARVKATGFGRTDMDVRETLRVISAANPAALMFGTDLPSTRAPRPFEDADLALVLDTLGQELGNRVLLDNAVAFYRTRQAGITPRTEDSPTA